MEPKIKIAVDAMGGENSPKKVIYGILENYKNNKDIIYNIFGDKEKILILLPKNFDKEVFNIIDTKNKILDTDSPLSAAKKGKDTSMWLTIQSVKNNDSDVAISAGNTGALFVISKLNLKMIENIDKPALSALWPNKNNFNVVLDLGANIECNNKNLVDFSIMGSSLFKSLYPNDEPVVALLNIGSEELKGNDIIKKAYQDLTNIKNKNFNFYGYVEGNQIMDSKVNVIVTDGFTGNIALKTAEGTANFIVKEFKKSMTSNFLGKLSGLINFANLNKIKKKLDPRLYNGAILIGLDSPVVKSHGSTDYIGFSNSLNVCVKIVRNNLIQKIKDNISK
ncbi:phosphate acyltransferase PlsX [Candidatus Pelagibacter sp.]|nr:phosphate acyltransferase PlsX [Candidatus Pelagibacter sp.]